MKMMVSGKSFIMKKINILFVAASFALAACHEIEIPVPAVAPAEIHASIEDVVPSKTMMTDNNSICWTEGDHIVVFFKNTVGLRYQVDAESVGKSYATFNRAPEGNVVDNEEVSDLDHNIAYYPYSSSVVCNMSESEYVLDVFLSEVQTYMEDSFGSGSLPMVSVSERNTSSTYSDSDILHTTDDEYG